MTFTFDIDGKDLYPRKDSDKSYVDFAVFNTAEVNYQSKKVSMSFDSNKFSWFAGAHSKSNLEFASALEKQVMQIYRDSWIYSYFEFDVMSENGIVFFYNKKQKKIVNSSRFKIYVYIPKKTRLYFFPSTFWDTRDYNINSFIEVDVFSQIPHGFMTLSFPTSKSLFYESPYFFSVKTSHSIIPNFLSFNNKNRPNSENAILAMVYYDDNIDNLQASFNPVIELQHLKLMPANSIFEFTFYDSNKKQIQVAENSQLYVLIVLH